MQIQAKFRLEAEVTTYDFKDGYGEVPAHQHPKGGGWVADTATVSPRAYVGKDAKSTVMPWYPEMSKSTGVPRYTDVPKSTVMPWYPEMSKSTDVPKSTKMPRCLEMPL